MIRGARAAFDIQEVLRQRLMMTQMFLRLCLALLKGTTHLYWGVDFSEISLRDKRLYGYASLGNIGYDNTNFDSKTAVTSLDNRYDVYDGQLLLRDNLGYSLFKRSRSQKLLSHTVQSKRKPLDQYFVYEEQFDGINSDDTPWYDFKLSIQL